jgi:peptidoglycan hydrolase-like protein with peptidoglycan-binding domain
MLAMHGRVSRAGLAVIAISLCTLPAGAVATGRIVQNASEAGKGATEPIQAPVAGAPAELSANSRDRIRKAQIELRRLDCLSGRIDGKLGDQTRQAVRKFWGSAKQPVVEVNITDELIANLAEHGDNFCRPPRRFFGFGGRRLPPLLAPGARPGIVAPTAAQPVSPDAAH